MPDGKSPGVDRSAAVDSRAADSLAWRDFRQATTPEAFCRGWLAVQCRLLPGVVGAALFGLQSRNGSASLAQVAAWGEATRNPKLLADVARRALSEGRGVVVRPARPADRSREGRCLVAYPARANGGIVGAVAVEVTHRSGPELQAVLRHLQWGSGWLEALATRRTAADQQAARERLRDVLDATATALAHERFLASATAFVTAVAAKLGCDRVSVGFVHGARVRVRAISHTAHLGDRTNLLRALGAAMDEAIDQRQPIAHPPPAGDGPRVARAAQEIDHQHAVLTVPFACGARVVGALTLERPILRPFDRGTVELVEAVAALAGPVLDVLRRDDRWLVTKAVDAGRQQLAGLIGPRRIALKLGAVAVAAAAAVLVLATGEYRVAARAVMEADVRRVAVAPFDGYVRDAPARAGDLVRGGQLLVALDDRDLRLERARWSAQREQLVKQQHQALAARNAAQIAISAAQIDQAGAQLALIDEQLTKSRVVAGVDGVVVSGDLSQALGAPVEKGQVLFQVAPLDAFRVVLQVDERDVSDVAVGQRGTLRLAAAPDTSLAFTVGKITPVSTAREGQNYFRVEAKLERTPERLQPGMEGIGKISVDERRLVWIWLRSLVDWARLALWTWTP